MSINENFFLQITPTNWKWISYSVFYLYFVFLLLRTWSIKPDEYKAC